MNPVTCCRCGQVIKNTVDIDGKIYGTKCAERILGVHDLPKVRNLDARKYLKSKEDEAKKIAQRQAEAKAEVKAHKESWRIHFDLAKKINNAYSEANNWEQNFLHSICAQLNFRGIIGGACNSFDNVEDFVNMPYFSSQYCSCSAFRFKGLDKLSDRQREIFDRILNKY